MTNLSIESKITMGRVRARSVPTTFSFAGPRALAPLLIAVFCLVIASPNLPTALLPDYRETYGLSPFGLSLVFAGYLAVLVPALLLCTRSWFRRHSALLLVTGLSTAIISSIVMALASSTTLLVVGRGLAGLSVGLATGAAASLVVSLTGERGRGSVASGNLIGGLLGTAAAVMLAHAGLGERVYVLHAVVCVLAMLVLVPALFWLRRTHRPEQRVLASSRTGVAPKAVVVAAVSAPPLSTPAVPVTPERLHKETLLGTIAGAISWTAPGIVLALLPAVLRNVTGPSGILVATSPVLVFLGAAWGLQLVARIPLVGRAIRGHEVTIGIVVCALGLLQIGLSALLGAVVLAYVGCLLAAAGPALAYRGGMVLCTRGMTPAEQGAATSRYAAISYGVSAVIVIGCGALGATYGIENGVATGCFILIAAAAALVSVIRRMERRTS